MGNVEDFHGAWWADLVQFGDSVLKSKRQALGMTQAQMAARIGIDRSRISIIEAGKGKPKDVPTAQRLALEYRLSTEENAQAFSLWFGRYPRGDYLGKEFEEQNRVLPESLYKIRIGGNPKLVIELANDRLGRLSDYISHADSPGETTFYKEIMAKVLYELITAHMEVSPPPRIWANVRGRIQQLAHIAEELHDKNIFGLVNLNLGDAYYLTRNYEKSLRHLELARQNIQDVDEQLTILRVSALDWGHLKDKMEVKKVETRVVRLIEEGNFMKLENVSQAFEGLGRAQALIYVPQAFDTIQRGWDILGRVEKGGMSAPLRAVQLARSDLDAWAKLASTDKSFESRGREFLELARRLGYSRHEQKILRLLKTHLE